MRGGSQYEKTMFGDSKHHLGVVLACPALATSSEEEIAAEYLKEQGILEGDQNGDMNLASGLTRAQLAAVLTRLNGNQEHVQAEQEFYISQCKFRMSRHGPDSM